MTRAERPALAVLAVLVVLVALTVVVYSPSLGGGFLEWDDSQYVLENPELRLPLPRAVGTILTTSYFSNYNPVHRLAYLALVKTFGADPLPFRLLNLGLHLATACLLFFLLRRWLGETAAAALAAVLFAVHPSNVENVAWISETKMLLSAVFGFAATLAWLRYRDGWRPGYWLALALFTAGLASKTGIVVLPALLWLLDRSAGEKPRLRSYLPFLAPAILFSVLQVLAASQPAPWRQESAITGLHGGGLATHAATIVAVLPRYLAGVLWPFGQAHRHDFADVTALFDPRFLVGLVLLAVAAFAVVRSWRGERRLAVGVIWFLLTLLPMLVVPIPILYAERYLYLGMPFLLGVLMSALPREATVRRTVARAGAGLAIGLFATSALLYSRTWTDDVSLWERAARSDGKSAGIWFSYSKSLTAAGDTRAAVRAARRAHEIDGESRAIRQTLALAEAAAGNGETGIAILRELTREETDSGTAWANLAMLQSASGDERAAAATFRDGLTRFPEDAYLWRNLGKFHLNHGRLPEGAKSLEHAGRHAPKNAETWRLLAAVYRRVGLTEDAERCETALAKTGNFRP